LIENGYRQQEILIKENFRDKVGGYIFTKDGVIQRHQDEDLMKKIKKQQQKEDVKQLINQRKNSTLKEKSIFDEKIELIKKKGEDSFMNKKQGSVYVNDSKESSKLKIYDHKQPTIITNLSSFNEIKRNSDTLIGFSIRNNTLGSLFI